MRKQTYLRESNQRISFWLNVLKMEKSSSTTRQYPQDDVNLMFTKIQKLSEQDKLMLMRKEIKFKKLFFSEFPKDFILFKQYNLSSSKMYQNLLALHAVESAHQEDISVEDIYEVAESLASLPALHTQKLKRQSR